MNHLRRLFFDAWYLGRPPWDTGISPPELIEFLDTHPPARAIDLGCGTGTNLLTLLQRGWQASGVDFAPRAVRHARRRLEAAGLRADLRVGDVTRLDGIRGPFELAFDLGCFHTLSEAGKADYLRQMERILAPGGFWLIYGFLVPHPDQPPGGLDPALLERIQARMRLIRRTDSRDPNGRASTWLLYQKQSIPPAS
jgi:SAM-dependent methyltransferase